MSEKQNFGLCSCIPNSFYSFFLSGLFVDCTILSSNNKAISCHKILLAKHSKWFFKYFQSHDSYEVVLPFDPDNLFSSIIEFLYTNKIHFTKRNVVPLIASSKFYGISDLEKLAIIQLQDFLSLKNTMSFSSQLVEYNLTDLAINVVSDNITRIILNIIKNKKNDINVFTSINPKLLFNILKRNEFSKFDDQQKVALIEAFSSHFSGKISDSEKVDFTSLINWNTPDSISHFLLHDCNWVTLSTQRKFLSQILDNRKNTLSELNSQLLDINKPIGRLNALHSLYKIGSSSLSPLNEDFDITNFVFNLGIPNLKIDPEAYGLITINSSTPISSDFQAKYALQIRHGHYFTTAPKSILPFFSISFDTFISISSLTINFSEHNKQRPPPPNLVIEFDDQSLSDEISLTTPSFTRQFRPPLNAKKLCIRQSHFNDLCNLLRITSLTILGHFIT